MPLDPREMAHAAIRRACVQSEQDIEEAHRAEEASATIIEHRARQDAARRRVAKNVIAIAKARYPHKPIQESRILKTLRDARALLDEIENHKPQPQTLGKLLRYPTHHRLCLISCGPGCPAAPLHEEPAPKKQPSLFYLHESTWKH
jgi:hypothetical protein